MLPKHADAAPRSPGKAKRKILVVEDDGGVRELLKVHLDNGGYDVVAVADAVLAGQSLLEGASGIDLLIVDAQLPYMSGLEFVSTLIADTTLPSVPMILITGHEHLASRAEILEVPCLVKPFSTDDLIDLVEKSMAAPRPVESDPGLSDRARMPIELSGRGTGQPDRMFSRRAGFHPSRENPCDPNVLLSLLAPLKRRPPRPPVSLLDDTVS